MLSPAVQVLPICWLFTPDPSVQVVCAFFVSTSPALSSVRGYIG